MNKKKYFIKKGDRFGSLVVLWKRKKIAKVRCDCGTEKKVRIYPLIYGETKTCRQCHKNKLLNTKYGNLRITKIETKRRK